MIPDSAPNYEKMDIIDLTKLAYDKDDPIAQNLLGEAYRDGFQAKQNHGVAASLFYKAAKNKNPDALVNLGIAFAKGQGVPKNPEKARELFRIAVRDGRSSTLFKVGEVYAKGLGVRQDVEMAVLCWLRAAGVTVRADLVPQDPVSKRYLTQSLREEPKAP